MEGRTPHGRCFAMDLMHLENRNIRNRYYRLRRSICAANFSILFLETDPIIQWWKREVATSMVIHAIFVEINRNHVDPSTETSHPHGRVRREVCRSLRWHTTCTRSRGFSQGELIQWLGFNFIGFDWVLWGVLGWKTWNNFKFIQNRRRMNEPMGIFISKIQRESKKG